MQEGAIETREYFVHADKKPAVKRFKRLGIQEYYQRRQPAFCCVCLYLSTSELDPQVKLGLGRMEQLIRTTPSTGEHFRAERIAHLYEQHVRELIPGKPECPASVIQDHMKGMHIDADLTVFKQHSRAIMKLYCLLLEEQSLREDEETGEIEPDMDMIRLRVKLHELVEATI